MKIRTIALSTFAAFLRNRVIILFCSLFLCVILLMISPLLAWKAMTTASNARNMEEFTLYEIAMVMSLVSGFGSLLAAWAAADAVRSEMKSGTILAVMARPLHRWEFLAGKYAAVLLLMGVYAVFMLAVSYLLAWLGGQHIHTAAWTLVVYPLVRYSIYAAIALLLATVVDSALAMAAILVLATAVQLFRHPSGIPEWLRLPIHVVLPSTNLLSEERFLMITQAALRPTVWTEHLTALAYGLDYAAVFFLLAVWSFHHRSLTRN